MNLSTELLICAGVRLQMGMIREIIGTMIEGITEPLEEKKDETLLQLAGQFIFRDLEQAYSWKPSG